MLAIIMFNITLVLVLITSMFFVIYGFSLLFRQLLPSFVQRIGFIIAAGIFAVLLSLGMILVTSRHGVNLAGIKVSASNLILMFLWMFVMWMVVFHLFAYFFGPYLTSKVTENW